MTLSPDVRLDNHKTAFSLLLEELGDRAIDVTVFQPDTPAFKDILRTTWESLERDGYLSAVASLGYRLTAKGWLLALEASKSLGTTTGQPTQLPTQFPPRAVGLSNAQEQMGAEDFPNFVLAA